jgi:RNA polymerase sigma factor (sigma-70 family)
LAAVPSIGRATRIEGTSPPEAGLTQALYEEYANQIFRYCLHQLGSREEAEDAVQSTFLNAFRGLKRGVVPELEAAWLFKIAHNVCLSRRRSSWRRGRVESPADFDTVQELTPAPSRAADELIGLQDVLEQMPESQRRAILLREWQGLSYREIAAELEVSQGAVETLIFRARRALAAGLEEPPERARRRLLRGLDLGSLAAGLKALLVGGSGAAKIAAVVAVASATTVVAADPVVQHRQHSHAPKPARTAVPAPRAPASHTKTESVVVPAASRPAPPVPVRRRPLRAGRTASGAPTAPPGALAARTAAPGALAAPGASASTPGHLQRQTASQGAPPTARPAATLGSKGRHGAGGKSPAPTKNPAATRVPQGRSASAKVMPAAAPASGKPKPAGLAAGASGAAATGGGKSKDPTG